jgi:hypothetical protein
LAELTIRFETREAQLAFSHKPAHFGKALSCRFPAAFGIYLDGRIHRPKFIVFHFQPYEPFEAGGGGAGFFGLVALGFGDAAAGEELTVEPPPLEETT